MNGTVANTSARMVFIGNVRTVNLQARMPNVRSMIGAMNIIRKGQIRRLPKADIVGQVRFAGFATLPTASSETCERHAVWIF